MFIDLKREIYTLLYVEDNKITRQLTTMFLKPYFKKIIEAENGKEALSLYTQHKPNIIITDIEMPLLNGIEFCREIRKTDLQTPIIITTAHTCVEYLLEAVELNLIKYIPKPLDENSLLEALKLCFERIELHSPSIMRLNKKLYYDALNQVLTDKKNIIPISSLEAKLLDILIKNSTRVVHYEELESHVWEHNYMSKDALRSLVKKVRQTIGKEVIENISKTGYKIKLYG